MAAIADAGLNRADIDGLSTYPVLAPFTEPDKEIITVPSMQRAMELTGRVKWFSESQEGMIGAGVAAAYHALRSGACDYALVWRALYMPKNGRYNQSPPSAVGGHAQFTGPYGMSSYNGLFSALYSRYFDLYQGNREKLSTIATAQRSWANKNPDALFKDIALSKDEYMNARMLSDAVCLFDCDIPLDGASAIVMTTADRAKDLDSPAAFVTGIVQGGPQEAELWDLEAVQSSMAHLGGRIWSESGLSPADMDAAMLYDGFSLFPVLWAEGLGFCGAGEGLDFIQDGRIAPGGALPMNTGGGSLSQGRLHGLGHVIEAARQVTGRAGDRQVPGAKHAVATVAFNINGMALTVSSDAP
ncbi:thiolase C-terminal domain-containing protein [Microbacterium sp. A93]|uniref:thiolase C-terminal domain-containing protein n=1 Tax=Microbacterium sp. A93 TaxID=3450716 RepID=UPI003F43D133